MVSFHRTLVFRNTIFFVGLLVALQTIIFSVFYWSTVAAYEENQNAEIQAEFDLLVRHYQDGSIEGSGGRDHLPRQRRTGGERRVSAGHPGVSSTSPATCMSGRGDAVMTASLIDIDLGRTDELVNELHRVRLHVLPSGHKLLVGRNLTMLLRFRELIAKAVLRTVALTVLLGFGGGYLVSRTVARRLGRINRTSMAVLTGDISQRVPRTGSGDEIDVLSDNLNLMLDRIEDLMQGMRNVSDSIAHDMRKPISRLRSRIELTLMGPREAELYRDALVSTLEELDDVLTVFNALLTIAIAESGAARDFEEIDLSQIARSAAELYEPVAEDAGLTLEVRASQPVAFRGNPHLITQALANLIDNAIKYAARFGHADDPGPRRTPLGGADRDRPRAGHSG